MFMYLVGAQCTSDLIYVAIILLDQPFEVKSDALRLKLCDSFLYLLWDFLSQTISIPITFKCVDLY